MKILVIAPPRTGGNMFSKWLSSELSYKWIHEPFKPEHNMLDIIEDLFSLDDIVVKLITYEWNNYYDTNKLLEQFDKIICLTRDNIFDSSISLVKAMEINNFTGRYNVDDKWIEENRILIESNLERLIKSNLYTKEIENSLQITYEGIYETKQDIKKVMDFLNIEKLIYFDMIDPKNKYRNNKNKPKLL
jgi:hypothetical protein